MAFDALLRLQEHDTTLDQLRHRRATLPIRSELTAAEAELAATTSMLDDAAARRDAVADRQSSLEADIAAAEKRIAEIDARMYSGEVTAGRDLQAMQQEIESLRRRVSSLEDDALAAMEEREPLDAEVDEIEQRRRSIEGRIAGLHSQLTSEEAELDIQIASVEATRTEAVASVDPGLLGTYEQLRGRLGGIGAARLDAGRCTGCHLTLPATELDRLHKLPPDELAFCDQCGRILVR